jgi:hypothetical protein
MSILEPIEETIVQHGSIELYRLLQFYEEAYPPDIALKMDSAGMFDIDVYGGDIGIVGFWHNSSLDSIRFLASQDLLTRIMINESMSVLYSGFNGGLPPDATPEIVESLILMAASDSPFIQEITHLRVEIPDNQTVRITLRALTITGEVIKISPTTLQGD